MFQSVISRFAGACRTLAAGLAATVCAAVATSCADGAADKEEKAAEAVLRVTNVMLADTLGRPGRIVDEAVFTVKLVRRSGRWLVRMEGLPQSGKRNRG